MADLFESLPTPRSNYPELLNHLADSVCSIAMEFGIDRCVSEQIGHEVAVKMATDFGGQNVYIPIGLTFKLHQRDLEIFNQFNGNNHNELARINKICVQRIYKIIKAVRAREIARRQGGLFPVETQ